MSKEIAIFGIHIDKDEEKVVEELLQSADELNYQVCFEFKFAQKLQEQTGLEISAFKTFKSYKEIDKDLALFISIGGDGTMLRASNYIRDKGIPLVGINTGRLGFLSTYKKEHAASLLNEFSKGNYELDFRQLIRLENHTELLGPNWENDALNEITVSRKDTASMITIEVWLNDHFLTSYWADGLIMATPTGSTGYSLSCGGPVISPGAKSFVLTPIAPHNLNARPLVIEDDTVIKLKVSGRESQHLITVDSKITTMANEEEIVVKKTPYKLKMLNFKGEHFLHSLRQKMLWGEDKRN